MTSLLQCSIIIIIHSLSQLCPMCSHLFDSPTTPSTGHQSNDCHSHSSQTVFTSGKPKPSHNRTESMPNHKLTKTMLKGPATGIFPYLNNDATLSKPPLNPNEFTVNPQHFSRQLAGQGEMEIHIHTARLPACF